MRELIKDFVRICAEALPLDEPIYEFGSLQVPGQEGFADLRPLFPAKQYVGTDMREGPGVDRILDLRDLALPDESVGTALMMDTIEHVELPHQALENLHKVMRADGIVILSSVMRMGIHAYPSDYWRFTPEGFRVLLRPFAESFVSYAGREKFPHTVVGVGFKGRCPPLEEFTAAVAQWQQRWKVPRREPLWQKWARKFRKSSRQQWSALLHKA